ncbi:MAG: hypothetical protein JWO67_4859 [Streptosporangiaceae bacterium]|nr:hypothetical protein [Streptosporangiaceae bacterium]
MATLQQLQNAIFERIGEPLPDLTGYAHLPDLVEVPAYYVEPDRQFLDYEVAFQSGMGEYKLLITVLVDKIDEEKAQQDLEPYLDPFGPFITALRAQHVGDTLDNLTNGFVEVTHADGYGYCWDKQHQTVYYGAQIHITVRA